MEIGAVPNYLMQTPFKNDKNKILQNIMNVLLYNQSTNFHRSYKIKDHPQKFGKEEICRFNQEPQNQNVEILKPTSQIRHRKKAEEKKTVVISVNNEN